MDSNNDRSRRDSDRPFFISPLLEKRKNKQEEKKQKLQRHYEDDLKSLVFNNWVANLQVQKRDQMPTLNALSTPLYLDIVNSIDSNDPFGESRSHLQTGYADQKV
jgi:hypothetical protein